METGQPLTAAVVALIVFQILTLLAAAGLRWTGATRDGAAANGRPSSGWDGLVECPACGTENEAEYRFCRQCVGELPRATSVTGSTSSPLSRGTL